MTFPSVTPMITDLFGELLFGADGELFGVGGELLFVGGDKFVGPGISLVDVGGDVSVGTSTLALEGSLCGAFTVVVVVTVSGAIALGTLGAALVSGGAQAADISCPYFANISGHTSNMHSAICIVAPLTLQ